MPWKIELLDHLNLAAAAALLLLLALLPLLVQIFLDLVNLLDQQVVVLGSRVGHLVHVALDFARVRHEVVHAPVEHGLRVGRGEDGQHQLLHQVVAEIGRD